MIEVKHVSKTFDNYLALDDVNMHVEQGEIYGLVGPNGAGKSTIIRHLTGVFQPDRGEILIDGQPVYENVEIKNRIAYIPDDLFYFLQANTLDMMKYYKGIYPNFNEKTFYRLQEFFPSIDVKRNIRRLSKGMQKQVAFWLSLCIGADLMILDEPVDGLDPVMRRQVWNLLLSEVEERKMTVLVSTHNLRELETVCSRVGIINKGHIVLEHTLSELQGNTFKVQIACNGMPHIPEQFPVLNMTNVGRVFTLIVQGNRTAVLEALRDQFGPNVICDVVPLNLEEIFIYEMGGEDYEIKEILI